MSAATVTVVGEEVESAGSERDEASERADGAAAERCEVCEWREIALLEWTESAAAADRWEGVNEASEASDRTLGGAAECAEGGVGGGAAPWEAIFLLPDQSCYAARSAKSLRAGAPQALAWPAPPLRALTRANTAASL